MTDAPNLYMEFVGGLGDAILRMYFSGNEWYGALDRLAPGERATVVLMCHNPNLRQIFEAHPKRAQIEIRDLGFDTPFHPWESEEWRIAHEIPPKAPCPPHAPAETLKFYPWTSDLELLEWLRGQRFLVFCATAGTDERTIPEETRKDIAQAAIAAGFKILLVGSSRYFHGQRNGDLDGLLSLGENDVINGVDWITVPGVAEAVKLAAGCVVAHTSVLHMAWSERRPVFLLYNQWMKETLLPHGPVGYMQGINRPDTDHMEFSEYSRERAERWLAKL